MKPDTQQINNCKNCGNTYTGRFCNLCGQPAYSPIDSHYITHEIQHSIFHVDGGIFYTIKELFKRPGHTIREYLEGKRIKHFKPITFVLILSIIHNFLEHIVKRQPFIETFLTGMLEGIKNSKNATGANFSILEWLISHYSYTALILIPFFSLASYLVFRKSKYNYYEHLVLNAYTVGLVTVIFILMFPISYLFNGAFAFFFGIAFAIWTYLQFFNMLPKLSVILRLFLTYLLFFVIMFIITALLVAVILR